MPTYIALLRAINVGGTGKLPMAELKQLCLDAGFGQVRTYIQSGNVVLSTSMSRAWVQSALEAVLAERLGKPGGVFLRTPQELRAILEANPFPDAPPNRVLISFLAATVEADVLSLIRHRQAEEVVLHGREVYIYYPAGQGQSKLKLPASLEAGTARNVNTVQALYELSASPEV